MIRNLLLQQRAGNTINREAKELLEQLFAELAAEVARVDPTGYRTRRGRDRAVKRLLAKIKPVAGASFARIRKVVRQRLAELGKQQAWWATRQLRGALIGAGTVAAGIAIANRGLGINYFKAILDADPFEGDLLDAWLSDLSETTVKRIRRQIQLGMTRNETLSEIVRRVRGRRAGRGFVGGVWRTTTRDAETVVRTAVTFISNRAHLESYRQNAKIVSGVRFVAVLDSRTSDICIANDGRVWALDDPKQQVPPLHPNCRSQLVPEINFAAVGLPPPPAGQRASESGPVSSSVTYEQWLRRQSFAKQVDILGRTRARLFRAGKLSLRDLVKKDGTTVTVNELRARVA